MDTHFSLFWIVYLLFLMACDSQSKQVGQSASAEETRQRALMEAVPNSPDVSAVETLLNVLKRSDENAKSPLTNLIEANSSVVQTFTQNVDIFLATPSDGQIAKAILRQLRVWEANHRPFLSTSQQNPSLVPYEPMSKYLSVISNIGTKAVHAISNQTTLPEEEPNYYQEMLELASEPVQGTELAMLEPIRRLIEAASL